LKSSRRNTRCPAVSEIVPLFSVAECDVQLFTSCVPFTHSRTPSSLTVKNVYEPVAGATSEPVHRTE
jgi:hypothetical protein